MMRGGEEEEEEEAETGEEHTGLVNVEVERRLSGDVDSGNKFRSRRKTVCSARLV